MLSKKFTKKVSIYIVQARTFEDKNLVNQVVTKTVQMCCISHSLTFFKKMEIV